MNETNAQVFRKGMKDAIPIGLGYLAVAFSLGIAARNAGMNAFQGFLMSMLNNASAGEYAGITVIAANSPYVEIAIVTLITNARYLLMSCAMGQRLTPGLSFGHRLLMGFDITDELFGIAIARPGYLHPWYTYGAMTVAIPGWGSRNRSWRHCRKYAACTNRQCSKCLLIWNVPCNHHSSCQEGQSSCSSDYTGLFIKLLSFLSASDFFPFRRNQNHYPDHCALCRSSRSFPS